MQSCIKLYKFTVLYFMLRLLVANIVSDKSYVRKSFVVFVIFTDFQQTAEDLPMSFVALLAYFCKNEI